MNEYGCCILYMSPSEMQSFTPFFFLNDTAPTEIYTLSYTTLFRSPAGRGCEASPGARGGRGVRADRRARDRKSTRRNSSHMSISYAVFCLKKKRLDRRRAHAGQITRRAVAMEVLRVVLVEIHEHRPLLVFFFVFGRRHQALHSFPTRRPSD